MMRAHCTYVIAILFLVASQAQAQGEKSLTRDEVSVVKKKLVSIFEAVGQPPAGYSMESETYSLPTDAYPMEGTSNYSLVGASAFREFGTKRKAEDASKDLEKEYKKKMLEAQAKGDYQEMAKLGQEMTKKMGQQSLETEESQKEPINIHINLNGGDGEPIDPDAVVHEQSGAIALKTLNGTPEKGRVRVYFDPVALKETKQLSKVTLTFPQKGVAKRTAVLHAVIELAGPAADIEAWAKKIDFKKVLAQIDR
jgi:hypothetical protein